MNGRRAGVPGPCCPENLTARHGRSPLVAGTCRHARATRPTSPDFARPTGFASKLCLSLNPRGTILDSSLALWEPLADETCARLDREELPRKVRETKKHEPKRVWNEWHCRMLALDFRRTFLSGRARRADRAGHDVEPATQRAAETHVFGSTPASRLERACARGAARFADVGWASASETSGKS